VSDPAVMRDQVSDEVSVLTVFDQHAGRWTTTIVGGPMDGYQITCRDDDADAQHAAAIEQARTADAARS